MYIDHEDQYLVRKLDILRDFCLHKIKNRVLGGIRNV